MEFPQIDIVGMALGGIASGLLAFAQIMGSMVTQAPMLWLGLGAAGVVAYYRR